MALLDLLNESYVAHPEFHTPDQRLSACDEHVELLNRVWREFLAGESTPTEGEIRDAIERVFQSLKEQAGDPLLNQFVCELHELTVKHFLGDLEFLTPRWSQQPGPLTSDRYFFTELSPSVVARIRHVMDPFLTKARALSETGETRRQFLSVNSGARVRKVVRALNKEFGRLGVLEEVASILPRKARVVGLAVELSVPSSTWWRNAIGDGPGPTTMYAHFDEGIEAPKAIVYLKEVRPENGPTTCFPGVYEELALSPLQDAVGRAAGVVGNKPGSPLAVAYGKAPGNSMSSPLFREHFMALPDALRFNSHFGWDILPASEIEAQLAGREVVMTGPPGTAIVFDGARLLHRGGLVDSGERVALQVIFGNRSAAQWMSLAFRKATSALTSRLRPRSK